MLARLRHWAGALKRDILMLWLAARDDRVPGVAKLLALLVVGYALSPIDLIPDFIPVLGLLDDLLLLPGGIWLTLGLIPAGLIGELRASAAQMPWPQPSWIAAAVIVATWLALAVVAALTWSAD